MQPIGPAPVTSTSSPSTGKVSAVCTALPKGSKIAATSSSTPGFWCQTFVIGSATQLGERARALHAEPDRVRAEMPPPGHAVAAAPAHDVPLAADEVADLEAADVRADLDDLADELVPDHHRHRDRPLRPRVPVVDVQVGAADPGLVHPDQDVVDPDLRRGDVLEPEARRRLSLHERLHVATLGENHGPAIREPPDAAAPRGAQGRGVDTFWTFIAIAVVVAILVAVLWAIVVAPVWVPRHSGKP